MARFRKVSEKQSKSEADKLVLQQLGSLGADMKQPREVIHYLYLPTRDATRTAAEALRERGYSAKETTAAGAKPGAPNPFLVLATKHVALTPAAVQEFRQLFEQLASFHNGEYDGWEVAAKP